MTTWELECEIKAKMEKETDQKEIRFLQSCLAEVLLLRSLKSHFYHTINIFGEQGAKGDQDDESLEENE